MDDFLTDFGKLGRLAARARQAPPLDPAKVRERIHGLAVQPPADEPPLRLIFGVGAAAAAATIAITALTASAWLDLDNPLRLLETLPDIASLLNS
jgi:hypothetical protein